MNGGVLVIVGISVGELTVQAAWVALLALAALTLVGWRKPARPTAVSARGTRNHTPSRHPFIRRVRVLPDESETAPSLGRRALSGLGLAALSTLTGAVIAIIASFLAIVAVVWATGLLGR